MKSPNPGAMHLAHTRLLPRLEEVPRDRTLLVHCQGNSRSFHAAAFLQRHGCEVVHLWGGSELWKFAGGEIVHG